MLALKAHILNSNLVLLINAEHKGVQLIVSGYFLNTTIFVLRPRSIRSTSQHYNRNEPLVEQHGL